MGKLSKREWIAIALSITFIVYVFYSGDLMRQFRMSMNAGASMDQNVMNFELDSKEVVVNDLIIGDGEETAFGDTLTVHYILALVDGTIIENSKNFGMPLTFTLGVDRLIEGWEQGVVGMKKGGIRTLIIPSHLAYGSVEMGPIPANSTLIFTIELVDIAKSDSEVKPAI